MFFDHPELGMRVKNRQTGLCFALVESEGLLGLSSKCHENYRLGADGRLTYTATNQVVSQNVTARNDGDRWVYFHPPGTEVEPFMFGIDGFEIRYELGEQGCVSAKTDMYIGVGGPGNLALCDQPENEFVALPGTHSLYILVTKIIFIN